MGKIVRVSGPVVTAEDIEGSKMFDVVRVGEMNLVGEIIRITGNRATIQVYEDTSGIKPGERVETTGRPLSVELGPGLLKSIYDGIQRPLDVIRDKTGDFIRRGYTASPLDTTKEWEFVPLVKKGDTIKPRQILGTVQETSLIEHKIMAPFNVSGTVEEILEGKLKITEVVAHIKGKEKTTKLTMKQDWPVRSIRGVKSKLP
ncbi:MAG: hypothetical protein M1496_02805, partial [Candidatus Thermoplasmatota archaeon]|nr:hypothetical protein [Candidatus Thermoplasmatota archaeon]